MKQVQFISTTPEQLQTAIIEGVKTQLEDLKKDFQPIEPKEYLERSELAKMLNVNLSTVHNWTVKGILTSYGIGRRVYYLRSEVESSIVKLKK